MSDTFNKIEPILKEDLSNSLFDEVDKLEKLGAVYIGILKNSPVFVATYSSTERELKAWGYKKKTRIIDGRKAGSFFSF